MPTIHAPAAVPHAHGGEITDLVLEAALDAANRANNGVLSDADGALLLLVCAPAFAELLQHRYRMEVIRDLAQGNVLLFPGARA